MRQIKIAKGSIVCDFSPDGTQLAIAGWGGAVRVVDVASGRKIATARGPGRGADAAIWHQAWSPDGRSLAFSGGGQVGVLDVGARLVVATIPIGEVERALTVPVAFTSDEQVIVPDGSRLAVYRRDGRRAGSIAVDPRAALGSHLAVSPDRRWIAYKAAGPHACDALFVLDVTGERAPRRVELPYEYVPGRAMFDAVFRWTAGGDLAVLHKTTGLSFIDGTTLETRRAASWAALGVRTLFNLRYACFDAGGRSLVINAESSSGGDDLEQWAVSIPEGMQLTRIGTESLQREALPRLGEGGFAIDEKGATVAALARRRGDRGRDEAVVELYERQAS